MKTNNKNWKPVTISGFTGILMGAGSMQGTQAIKSLLADGTANEENSEESLETAVSNDDLSFREAFDAARAELGPGGVFSWHGNLYNTYTTDEWSAMSEEDQDSFAEQVSPEVSPEDIDTSEFADAETVEENAAVDADVTVATDNSHEPEIATVEPTKESADDDVRVVGFGEVTLDNGQNVTVQELDVNGQRVAVIDVDQDGEADLALSDINNNHQMDEGEVIDLHTGESVSFTNDDTADFSADMMDM